MYQTKVYEVEMRAFMGGEFRKVEVPVKEGEEAALKDIVFFGQNEFTIDGGPQTFCSVSAGDVIRCGDQKFRILPVGYELVEEEVDGHE